MSTNQRTANSLARIATKLKRHNDPQEQRHGRYILFCINCGKLEEMAELAAAHGLDWTGPYTN